MASMASSLAGTPILARPRASTGTKSRRAMRCNASAVSDAAAADAELLAALAAKLHELLLKTLDADLELADRQLVDAVIDLDL